MDLAIGLARAGTGRAEMVVPAMRNPHIVSPETQTMDVESMEKLFLSLA